MGFTQFHNAWVYFYYELNVEEITAELCENKDRPELACHGKCQLMKAIEQQEEEEKELNRSRYIPFFTFVNDSKGDLAFIGIESKQDYLISHQAINSRPISIETPPPRQEV